MRIPASCLLQQPTSYPFMKHTSVCYSLFSFIWRDTPSQEEEKVSNIQIMLYTVGALSIIAFVWATLDARRRRAKRNKAQTQR